MEAIIKIFLPIYYVLYYFIFWRTSYAVYKRTGVNPYVFGKADTAHDYVGRFFKYITALIFIAITIFIISEHLYQYLMPFFFLEIAFFKIIGVILLIASLVWIATSQQQMKNSWRVGIDKTAKAELIQNGLFAISRNPVFLGTITTLIGLFLVIPNAVTLTTLAVYFVLIQIQVCLEEEYMLNIHGENYQAYFNKVKRWI